VTVEAKFSLDRDHKQNTWLRQSGGCKDKMRKTYVAQGMPYKREFLLLESFLIKRLHVLDSSRFLLKIGIQLKILKSK
jgi:hypothetical protein